MKKILVIGAVMGAAVGAFAQGAVLFDDFTAGNPIWLNTPGNGQSGLLNPTGAGTNPGGATWHVALLYSSTPGGGLAQSSLTEVTDYTPSTANGSGNGSGYFQDESGGKAVTISLPGAYATSGTFEVVSWLGTAATWATALTDPNTTYATQGANLVEFTDSKIANLGTTPPGLPASINQNGWNGNLTLTPVPEPTTIALGGLGAAALLLFRRRK